MGGGAVAGDTQAATGAGGAAYNSAPVGAHVLAAYGLFEAVYMGRAIPGAGPSGENGKR